MLSWSAGAVECQVIAAAGAYVLLKVGTTDSATDAPAGRCSLTYLDGKTPMGWDGTVEWGAHLGEIRFRIEGSQADRRSSVRLPVTGDVAIAQGDRVLPGRLLDISAGGLRFRHDGHLARGSAVRVQVQLPGGPLVSTDAVVRSAERSITAVEFTTVQHDVGVWTVQQLRSSLAVA